MASEAPVEKPRIGRLRFGKRVPFQMSVAESQLIARLKERDERAFNEVVRTHGDKAARFHVLALNWSGNQALSMSAVGIESPFAVPRASIVPPHCAQFRLSSKWRTYSAPILMS